MGCDIHGYIEVQRYENSSYWRPLLDIRGVVSRSYDTFGSLFGVRNYAGFDPLFADRGLPEDVGYTTRDEYGSWGVDAHSASYVTYDELQAVDWDEESEIPDRRYSVLDADGEPTGAKFSYASGWADVIEANEDALARGEAVPNEAGDKYLQRRYQTRADALSGAWEWLLFEQWPLLEDRFPATRMIVWFDN